MQIKALQFEDKGRGVHTAMAHQEFTGRTGEKTFTHIAVRTICEGLTYRIDYTTFVCGGWLPWEPVTSEHYSTHRDAVRAARKWARETDRSGQ